MVSDLSHIDCNIRSFDKKACVTDVIVGPDGQRETLVQDDRLVSPDALFIDTKRTPFMPSPQIQKLAMCDGEIR